MQTLQAPAFLALWNGVAPDMQEEYEAWHCFEHVPERTALPGFIETRRYRSADVAQRYFTCYSVSSLAAFESAGYHDVMAHPTPWSAHMRPALSDFIRLPCALMGQAGHSSASHLAVMVLDLDATSEAEDMAGINTKIHAHCVHTAVVSAQWGQLAYMGAYPVAGLGDQASNQMATDAHNRRWVVMLQGIHPGQLLENARKLCMLLSVHTSVVTVPEVFELLSHTRQDALPLTSGARLTPRMDLFRSFHPHNIPGDTV